MFDNLFEKAEDFPSSLIRLYGIISYLRSPDGCPWDRIQTNKSATESMIDECYEYLDAVIKNDTASEREEIGDIMINVFMTLCIHSEKNDFKPEDAVNEVSDKLIRRHPHVFGDGIAKTPTEVLSLWNSVKESEGHSEENIFSHIPSCTPPLEKAYEIRKKLKKVGFDWSSVEGTIDKLYEEINELKEAIDSGDGERIEEELGDVFFSLVNVSGFLGVRPGTAMLRANRKIMERFIKLTDMASEEGIPIDKNHVKEMNEIWDRIKDEEKKDGE